MKNFNRLWLLLAIQLLFSFHGISQPPPGLVLWLRADNGVFKDASLTTATDNSLVQVWQDQSGNGNHFTQTDPAFQPQYRTDILCGRPVVRFVINRKTFMQSAFRLDGPKTIFVVFVVFPFSNAAETFISIKDNSDKFTEVVATDFSGYKPITFIADLPSTAAGNYYLSSLGIPASFSSQGNIVCMKYNGGPSTAPGSYSATYDGLPASVTSGNFLGRYTADATTIGGRAPFQNINFLNGDIAEIMVFNRVLTTDETSYVHNYFVGKYGLYYGCVLPLQFHFFDVKLQDRKVNIEWKIEEANGIRLYQVQKSFDGVNWVIIDSLPKKSYGGLTSYSSIDFDPMPGINYYRIAVVDVQNKVEYSTVKKVSVEQRAALVVFPNPASTHIVIKGDESVKVDVRILNAAGKLVKQLATFPQKVIDITDLSAGVYWIEVEGNSINSSLKFIKK